MVMSTQSSLLEALDGYKRLSAESQELLEDILSTWGPEAQWTGDIRKAYRDFLDADAEAIRAFDAEIERAGEEDEGEGSPQDGDGQLR